MLDWLRLAYAWGMAVIIWTAIAIGAGLIVGFLWVCYALFGDPAGLIAFIIFLFMIFTAVWLYREAA